ncbi:MAG: amidase family protein, partial [Burkholderiaceae bacterium]
MNEPQPTDATTPLQSTNCITDWSAVQLAKRIAERQVSCREVMEAYLDQIERFNPAVNALVALQPREQLLVQADARDGRIARGEPLGWMHGFPAAPKDLASVAGMPTT